MKEGLRVLNCTKEQRKIIFNVADMVGCQISPTTRNHSTLESFPNLIFWDSKLQGDMAKDDREDHYNVTIGNFIDELLKYKKPKTVKLNSSYSAEIKDGKVVVGCQTFEFSAIEELYKLTQEVL